MRTNTAYDLYTFEPARPVVKVVDTSAVKRARKLNLKAMVIVYFVIIIALMTVTVYNHAVMTELQSDIYRANSRITRLERRYGQLSVELENLVSLQEAEAYAATELGLVKLDSSQVTYVKLLTENTFVEGETTPDALDALLSLVATIEDYFGQ